MRLYLLRAEPKQKLKRACISKTAKTTSLFHKALCRRSFDLRIDVKHAIFHNKVMIIDDETVITGSFNFTKAAEA